MSFPVHLLTAEDAAYPSLLRVNAGALKPLYYCGSLEPLGAPCISIIGSRSMTEYGRKVIRLLVPTLARAGLTVVSGLAYGVDGEAHRVAIEYGGSCIAVVGSGPDVVYPQANRALRQELLDKGGGVISSYAAGTPPLRFHFPERNRIVATLSPVTLIIEAGEKSGTLITARSALDAGREVCVVPADITRSQAAGVHGLLKQGARPVTSAEDILALYSIAALTQLTFDLRPALTGSPATLYDLISQGLETVEQLIAATGLNVSEVHSVLSVLELDGYIHCKSTLWQKT